MKKLILFITILTYTLSLSGQSLIGNVKNSSGEPLAYALIDVLNSNIHVHTNEIGGFTIKPIAVGDTIFISYLGYKDQTIPVTSISEALEVILEIQSINLDAITISNEVSAISVISDIDIVTRPVSSSQDLLRQVPGLFIGQHAGGGKAEQIFLRGFDIDHGTDISITVDNIPVNMVSHAHGQGYADLHFVIPETLEKIDFGTGPYNADEGNFNTAGYVNFISKKKISESIIKQEVGQFNTSRTLLMLKTIENENTDSYIAAEYLQTDGPFESPQNFQRVNVMGHFRTALDETQNIGLTLSHFNSDWDASGQIPERAVADGTISRFGAIDDTEGGITSRSNAILTHEKYISPTSFIKSTVFLSKYDFELFSNFTFFLDDPINGDQIRQKESRYLYGLNSEYSKYVTMGNLSGDFNLGLSIRSDVSNDNELSHTRNRSETLERIQLGDVRETNIGIYSDFKLHLGKLLINPGIRYDNFNFQYKDALTAAYSSESAQQGILSPKLNFFYNHNKNLQLYLKTGKGFHSNDTRVVVSENIEKTLPAAYGSDLGVIWKPYPRLILNTALWYLFLEQEFVYVGDAGIVEPSGRSARRGVDLSLRWQATDWLFWNMDANYTQARQIDEQEGADRIPLAPVATLTTGLSFIDLAGFSGGLSARYLQDRPANEDNSIVAEGYTVVDLNLTYEIKAMSFGLQIQNLLNTEWNETQFATESRLRDEPISVEEIHYTPGTPFFIKGVVGFRF